MSEFFKNPKINSYRSPYLSSRSNISKNKNKEEYKNHIDVNKNVSIIKNKFQIQQTTIQNLYSKEFKDPSTKKRPVNSEFSLTERNWRRSYLPNNSFENNNKNKRELSEDFLCKPKGHNPYLFQHKRLKTDFHQNCNSFENSNNEIPNRPSYQTKSIKTKNSRESRKSKINFLRKKYLDQEIINYTDLKKSKSPFHKIKRKIQNFTKFNTAENNSSNNPLIILSKNIKKLEESLKIKNKEIIKMKNSVAFYQNENIMLKEDIRELLNTEYNLKIKAEELFSKNKKLKNLNKELSLKKNYFGENSLNEDFKKSFDFFKEKIKKLAKDDSVKDYTKIKLQNIIIKLENSKQINKEETYENIILKKIYKDLKNFLSTQKNFDTINNKSFKDLKNKIESFFLKDDQKKINQIEKTNHNIKKKINKKLKRIIKYFDLNEKLKSNIKNNIDLSNLIYVEIISENLIYQKSNEDFSEKTNSIFNTHEQTNFIFQTFEKNPKLKKNFKYDCIDEQNYENKLNLSKNSKDEFNEEDFKANENCNDEFAENQDFKNKFKENENDFKEGNLNINKNLFIGESDFKINEMNFLKEENEKLKNEIVVYKNLITNLETDINSNKKKLFDKENSSKENDLLKKKILDKEEIIKQNFFNISKLNKKIEEINILEIKKSKNKEKIILELKNEIQKKNDELKNIKIELKRIKNKNTNLATEFKKQEEKKFIMKKNLTEKVKLIKLQKEEIKRLIHNNPEENNELSLLFFKRNFSFQNFNKKLKISKNSSSFDTKKNNNINSDKFMNKLLLDYIQEKKNLEIVNENLVYENNLLIKKLEDSENNNCDFKIKIYELENLIKFQNTRILSLENKKRNKKKKKKKKIKKEQEENINYLNLYKKNDNIKRKENEDIKEINFDDHLDNLYGDKNQENNFYNENNQRFDNISDIKNEELTENENQFSDKEIINIEYNDDLNNFYESDTKANNEENNLSKRSKDEKYFKSNNFYNNNSNHNNEEDDEIFYDSNNEKIDINFVDKIDNFYKGSLNGENFDDFDVKPKFENLIDNDESENNSEKNNFELKNNKDNFEGNNELYENQSELENDENNLNNLNKNNNFYDNNTELKKNENSEESKNKYYNNKKITKTKLKKEKKIYKEFLSAKENIKKLISDLNKNLSNNKNILKNFIKKRKNFIKNQNEEDDEKNNQINLDLRISILELKKIMKAQKKEIDNLNEELEKLEIYIVKSKQKYYYMMNYIKNSQKNKN